MMSLKRRLTNIKELKRLQSLNLLSDTQSLALQSELLVEDQMREKLRALKDQQETVKAQEERSLIMSTPDGKHFRRSGLATPFCYKSERFPSELKDVPGS